MHEAIQRDLTARIRRDARYVSLHVGDPGETGRGELNDAYYERQPVTWDADSRSQAEVAFLLEPCTYDHVGFWDRREGGTFQFCYPCTPTRVEEISTVTWPRGGLSVRVEMHEASMSRSG